MDTVGRTELDLSEQVFPRCSERKADRLAAAAAVLVSVISDPLQRVIIKAHSQMGPPSGRPQPHAVLSFESLRKRLTADV